MPKSLTCDTRNSPSERRALRFFSPAFVAVAALVLLSCGTTGSIVSTETEIKTAEDIAALSEKYEKASFAGGCFWCMEPPFERLEGVKYVHSGYQGGKEENPTYEQVSHGLTGHAEVVEVFYDPKKISYEDLLGTFWINIDPTDPAGQFADKGRHYRTEIFYYSDKQRELADKSKKELEDSGKFSEPIVTQIVPATTFWRAEEYHQDYYKKNPVHYGNYKRGSGREGYLKKTWGN